MIAESVLSTTVFVHPSSFSRTSRSPSTQTPNPKQLSLLTLETLSHLSFIISQFGGVTTTSTSDFPELKKTFYIALDVLSSEGDGNFGEEFVTRLCAEGKPALSCSVFGICMLILNFIDCLQRHSMPYQKVVYNDQKKHSRLRASNSSCLSFAKSHCR